MKSPEERHNEFLAYRAYCEEFLSHKRRNRLFAQLIPVKRVSCNCGCGEYWMDDLSDTNWLFQMLSIKSFFVISYDLHQAVKALHRHMWFAATICWMCATQSSRKAKLLACSDKDVGRLVSLVGRIWFLIAAIFYWNLSRLGGSFFLAGFLVVLAIVWATLSLGLALNAAMLLPFATSLIIGLAAGYFLEERWWIAVLCISIGTVFQYLQYRRLERNRQTELGRVLGVATGVIIPDTDKPVRVKTHGEVRAERSLASAAEPVFQDDIQAWLHLVKTGPPDLNAYPDTHLSEMPNPKGEGTFVYVPQTRYLGVERYVIWLVIENRAFALNGATKTITPSLPWPREAPDDLWQRTGLEKFSATEAIQIVFG